uniref:SAP domain-containing protein n=1 Tax=viral metagenome TaxID=1070528 RepID=A0A6C0JL02_9ZZZZ
MSSVSASTGGTLSGGLDGATLGGRRRTRRSSGLKTKTLRRMCKQKGMKTTGKKATLMKRLHMRGGALGDAPPSAAAAAAAAAPRPPPPPAEGGRRRRRSRRREE